MIGPTMSPLIRTMPLRRPSRLLRRSGIGTSWATGRPRPVMVMGVPLVSTSSIWTRHLALSSLAFTVRMVGKPGKAGYLP
jgi:hypothetical protein